MVLKNATMFQLWYRDEVALESLNLPAIYFPNMVPFPED